MGEKGGIGICSLASKLMKGVIQGEKTVYIFT